MSALPAELSTGMVHGRFIVAVIDGNDTDQEPDAIPAAGRVSFKASVGYVPVPATTEGPVTVMKGPIVGVIDSDGYLSTPHPVTGKPMYRGVKLLATDDPDMAVTDWTWTADYRFDSVNATTLTIPAHSFALPSGAVVDLTTMVKVPSSPGYGLPQAEAAVLRAEAAASRAEAIAEDSVPADGKNKELINNPGSETRAALDDAILDMLGPIVSETPIVVRGHSYTIVPGAYVQPGQEWSSVLAAKLGTTRTSYGRSGARMIECAAMAIAPSVNGITGSNTHHPGTKALTIIQCEMNDALSGPATAQGRLGFEHALRALLATVTAAKRIESSDPSVTTTGTWNTFTSNPIGSGGSTRYTAVNGNTLTFNDIEAPAGKAYILTFVHEQAEANIGSLTVEVDGVDQGITWNGGGKMQQFSSLVTSTGWPTYSHAVIPVNIPKTGSHTVKITKGGAAASAYVDAMLIPGAVPPPVLMAKDPPVGAFATQARQDAWAANSPYLHSIIDSVTAEFPSARVVDLGPGWDYTTMASTVDNAKFHPNSTGMQYIAETLTIPAVHRNLAHASAGAWA